MGRNAAEDSGNSEIFFMRAAARRLDRAYSVWGRTVVGFDVVKAVAVGVPPANPDRMIKVRVAADMPPAEQPRIEVMDERGAAFAALVEKVRKAKGADFSICDIEVPAREVR
jgi:peptidylprolyl isomerase